MGALGAITISITTFVIGFCHSYIEELFSLLYLLTDLWNVGYFEGGSVLLDDVHQGHIAKMQLSVNNVESFLWKVKCLLDEVAVLILHKSTKSEFVRKLRKNKTKNSR
jgi:hypothetical protein